MAIQEAIADKQFLDQIPAIEAAAMRRQMATARTAMAGVGKPSRPPNKKCHRVPTWVTLAVTVVVGVGGGLCHRFVTREDKPELVPPTGVVYEGEPLATPELWTKYVHSSPVDFPAIRSRRPVSADTDASTPAAWKRLHSQSLRRR